jgi:hypothetical protein
MAKGPLRKMGKASVDAGKRMGHKTLKKHDPNPEKWPPDYDVPEPESEQPPDPADDPVDPEERDQ